MFRGLWRHLACVRAELNRVSVVVTKRQLIVITKSEIAHHGDLGKVIYKSWLVKRHHKDLLGHYGQSGRSKSRRSLTLTLSQTQTSPTLPQRTYRAADVQIQYRPLQCLAGYCNMLLLSILLSLGEGHEGSPSRVPNRERTPLRGIWC